jgi:hypothetical protein
MLDFIFSIGQAAAALILIYGGYLVLMPKREAPRPEAAKEELAFLRS